MNWEWLEEYAKGMVKPLSTIFVLFFTIILSYRQNLGLEGEMILAILRSILQLSLVGFVLEFIFNHKNSTWIILAAYVFMVCVAGHTTGQRARQIPGAKYVAGASIFAGTSLTMLYLFFLKVFPFTPRYTIPVIGMMVASAMKVTGVTMKRLRDEMKMQRDLLETALALGATPRQAAMVQVKRAMIIALSPPLDTAKTMGLVFLPGAMTGLILGGASPMEAIRLQLVVLNLTFGASTFSSVVSVYLSLPCLFTKACQLRSEVLD